MSSETQRVRFRAPSRLMDRTGPLATVLGEDRTSVLVTAVREYLEKAIHDDVLMQEIEAAYYDDVISNAELESLVGAAEAANLRVLKQQLSEDFLESVAEQ